MRSLTAEALRAPRSGGVRLRACVAFGFALLFVGCSKPAKPAATSASGTECPEGQTFDGQFCQVTGAPPPEAPSAVQPTEAAQAPAPEPAGEPAASTPPDASTTPTGSTPPAPSSSAPAPSLATPVDVSMGSQAGPLITYLAGSHLPPGARPFGAPFAAQFAEGQVFEQQLKLTLGKCYTVVAAGLPPMSEVALELYDRATTTSAVGSVPAPLFTDDATGPQAVLGSRSACIKAERADVWLVVRATKGQGVVAGQVFEK